MDETRDMEYNKLNPMEYQIMILKGTERPFSGLYLDNFDKGVYLCKQCNVPLYKSDDKFESDCGWPSFDDEIEGAIKRQPDADGRRTEIVCNNCGGHLGHVFEGEGYTDKNTRHCVNSISLNFEPHKVEEDRAEAYFAAGCFWGVEYYFQRREGVLETEVGYMGGHKISPTYEEVCEGNSGHAEVIKVVYDKNRVGYEDLLKLFFEIHDFTQIDRQGPDVGEQYRGEVFYNNDDEKALAEKLIEVLKSMNYDVATKLSPKSEFWKAEKYHQSYYNKVGGVPYCHSRKKIF
ncbi:MAG: bifunctional methionine sulfoxide reductase B/A protein [Bacteroidales bacterium]|jgi:peptide methionine sulfoxide reductase msrA/msrB